MLHVIFIIPVYWKKIKKILLKAGIKPTLWPKKDEWDFEFNFKGEKWVIDAKDVKDPLELNVFISFKIHFIWKLSF